MRSRVARTAGIALCAAAALLAPAAAEAAFPGMNGRVVWSDPFQPQRGIRTVDDLNLLHHTLVAGDARNPAWSPDGSRVAFAAGGTTIEITDLAGNRSTVLAWERSVGEIDWSPAGDKLVANLLTCDDALDCRMDIYTMNLDGTDLTNLTPEPLGDNNPSWSPDGDRIVFWRTQDDATDIYTVAPDGSGLTNLTATLPATYLDPDWSPDSSQLLVLEEDPHRRLVIMDLGTGARTPVDLPFEPAIVQHPAWSPDGTRIAFEGQFGGVLTADLDGTDMRSHGSGGDPDWQPLHILKRGSGYPRPRHASRIRASLVPAYPRCGSRDPPEFQHGPPFALPSCHERLSGDRLMPGHNKLTGRLRLEALRGTPGNAVDEADVEISMSVTDVSCTLAQGDCVPEDDIGPWDYVGELQARIPLQATDRFNGAAPIDASATTMSAPLVFSIPCAGTPGDTQIGSTCSVTTTVDSVLPGSVPEGRRSVWQLGQIAIYDPRVFPGAEEEYAFLRQGIFVR